tara:strand:- start:328 stop:945 length:618 start_codon:yes stop_codon:yes gene_type:complete
MQFYLLIFIFLLTPFYALGTESNKFTIDGNKVIFESIGDEIGIDYGDDEILKDILLRNENIDTLQLNSDGGLVEASYSMSDIIIDFGLNTKVVGICESSCTTLFIAGEKRTMEKGSAMGFHRSWWGADSIKEYYDGSQDYYGWQDEFDFAEWLYEESARDVFKDFEFLLERNVEPYFAIKTLSTASDDMWYPRRKELIQAGVLRD